MIDSTRRFAVAALMFTLGTTGAAQSPPAPADPPGSGPSNSELIEEIRRLRERVESLEQSARNASTLPSAADIERAKAAINDDVARKAAARNVTVTYDRGLRFATQDGSFSLRPGIGAQFRYVAVSGGDGTDDESGFELRRIRPRIQGNALTKDLTFDFVLDANRNGGNVTLLDANGTYAFSPDWSLKFGQYKQAFSREGAVSDMQQMAVDRSLPDAFLGSSDVDRVQGLALIFGGGPRPVRIETSFSDGVGSKNTDFRSTGPNFGVGTRADFKLAGDWDAARDFSSKATKNTLFIFGGGFDITQADALDTYRSVVDAQFETPNGWSLYVAGYGKFLAGGESNADYGALGQVAYLVAPAWEAFARYGVIFFDEVAPSASSTVQEITAGVNYYFGPQGSFHHAAKMTLDVGYLPDGVPNTATGLGYLRSTGEQFVLRLQFTFQL